MVRGSQTTTSRTTSYIYTNGIPTTLPTSTTYSVYEDWDGSCHITASVTSCSGDEDEVYYYTIPPKEPPKEELLPLYFREPAYWEVGEPADPNRGIRPVAARDNRKQVWACRPRHGLSGG